MKTCGGYANPPVCEECSACTGYNSSEAFVAGFVREPDVAELVTSSSVFLLTQLPNVTEPRQLVLRETGRSEVGLLLDVVVE